MTNAGVSEDTTLRVMSYNIQGLPNRFFPVARLNQRLEAIVRFIGDVVKRYDVEVLILEEAYDKRLYRMIATELEGSLKYGTRVIGRTKNNSDWNTHIDTSRVLFHVMNGGICIFSKFPIEEKHAMIFKDSAGTCSFVGKGAILAVINKNGKLISVVGTHFQADVMCSRTGIRHKQFLQILQWLNDLFNGKIAGNKTYAVSRDLPIIMGGDFNSCSVNDAEHYNKMLNQCKDHNIEFKTTFLDNKPDPTYDTLNDFCRLQVNSDYKHIFDYIFVTPNVKVMEAQKSIRDKLNTPLTLKKRVLSCFCHEECEIYNASDHYPVFSVLSL
ncbi:sphingomyelin/lysocholinephospholipid-phospholipase C, putative [Theileria equi strain WA]|uniref:Sphingomyelin/lysocholinephospholipid-phospholipase C, putative n=1 Tax=Theileria equi strain WA TaxID=1537102 RepID=L1LGX6_THEEQ|nr:sphingomyelin/lysocholinephospholipid-phospholipase C, putative [Theileria equi strain WA]EKX74378.1 sphingomyelin/lysocholinephospholipid-phospholipase C, putative [Theileria equi strain WA]|eukprot:XP_004833830.1 sphingomyelin/lysocholinephospholipid-phospholipase C, putative [Theileria equi strain WA]